MVRCSTFYEEKEAVSRLFLGFILTMKTQPEDTPLSHKSWLTINHSENVSASRTDENLIEKSNLTAVSETYFSSSPQTHTRVNYSCGELSSSELIGSHLSPRQPLSAADKQKSGHQLTERYAQTCTNHTYSMQVRSGLDLGK